MPTDRTHPVLIFIVDNLLDLATLLVAVVVVIWHQVRPFDLSTLASWILAVLAMLAISGLWDRNRRLRRLEELALDTREIVRSQLNESPRAESFFNRNVNPKDLEDCFSSANHIFICGLTLTRTTRQFMDTFSKRVGAGADIRLAFLDPQNKNLMEIMVERSMGTTSPEYWETRLTSVMDVVHATVSQSQQNGSLQLGLAPFPPSFGLILIDPDEDHARCFVELYHHKTAEGNASFQLTRPNDPYWYSYFYNQWNELWGSCRIETMNASTSPTQAAGSEANRA